MSNLSGNKGEWSEVYAFLKLLGEGKLYGADSDLKRKDDIFSDISHDSCFISSDML